MVLCWCCFTCSCHKVKNTSLFFDFTFSRRKNKQLIPPPALAQARGECCHRRHECEGAVVLFVCSLGAHSRRREESSGASAK